LIPDIIGKKKGIFDTSYFDRGLSSIVDYYENATSLIGEKKTSDMLKNLDVKVDPLLEVEPVKWGQDGYFNVMCPYDEGAATYTKVGCVAVSMGQIMRYHRYPESGTGIGY
jgi:hypothetical protein